VELLHLGADGLDVVVAGGVVVDHLLDLALALVGAVLEIHAVALEDGVDHHLPDVHEGGRDAEGEEADDGDREDGRRRDIADVAAGDDEGAEEGGRDGDEILSDHDEGVGEDGERADPEAVAEEEEEGVLGGAEEARGLDRGLDVGVLVDEVEHLLEAPQAALAAGSTRRGS